jgi:hypothetical protein
MWTRLWLELLRIVLDTVEWGGVSGDSSSPTMDDAASGAEDTEQDR